MITLEEIELSSPVEIIYVDNFKPYGEYRLYNNTITIDNSLSENHKIFTLVHEITHANCHKKECHCFYPTFNKTICEYHAYKGVLLFVKKHLEFRETFLQEVQRVLNIGMLWENHAEAMTQVIKLLEYKELLGDKL